MKRMVGFGLLISGVALIGYAAFQIHWHHASAEKALAIAEEMITTQKESDQADSESVGELYKTGALRYQVDDVIGILSIPALEETYPIIEGTDEEMLMKGVGHYATTALPGGNEQILLSGHKGTVFQRLGELQPGDRFIVDMGYGSYEYEMRESEIVAADDTTVITPRGEEVLTLSTCYPFSYIGSASERYIIYAYPVAASDAGQE
ncbi:MAG: class D sortase [Trichococcus flocculiformis]|jgi:sortase A